LGNNLEEAILQGFYEALERDAIMIFMRNMVSLPDVDLETTENPFIKKICSLCDAEGMDISVKDFTSDFGIPIFFAQFYDEQRTPDYFFGFGSHLDPEIALTRAVTEAFQGRSSYAWLKKHFSEELKGAKVLPPHTALISAGSKSVSLREYETKASGNLRIDLEFCLSKIQELGMDLVVVDLSVPEVDFTAVKVMIVGSAYCDTQENPFFISPRVFDVPQKLGLTNHRPSEEELYMGPLIT
jgi:ribosomal protein S12 methylthiotransferase accessory factor